MITHEEARSYLLNILQSKTNEEVNKNELLLLKYFTQQEKQEELLEKVRWNLAFCIEEKNKLITKQQSQEQRVKKLEELVKLYKSVHGVVQSWDTMPDIQSQIVKLEKELEL